MIQEVRPEYAADCEITRLVPYVQLLTSLVAVAAAEHKGLSVDMQQVLCALKAWISR